MKVKLFVFGDVHGEEEALFQGLREAGFDPHNPQHIPLCTGDLFDRGHGSRELFEFMLKNRGIWVKGNHEIMLEEALEKGLDGEFVFFNMLHNGLDKTLASFAGRRLEGIVSVQEMEEVIERAKAYSCKGTKVLKKLKDLPLYFETKNYIFVHAGLDPSKRNWKDTDEHFLTWDIEFSHFPIDYTDKIVVIGHHHAFRVRAAGEARGWTPEPLRLPYVGNADEHAPVRFGNKIAIDPCSNLTKKINILIIEDELLEDKKEEEVKEQPDTSTMSNAVRYNYATHEFTVNYNDITDRAMWTTNDGATITVGRYTQPTGIYVDEAIMRDDR